MSELVVLVPLRPFGEGKSRLAGNLDEDARGALARAWAGAVLDRVSEAAPHAMQVVVGTAPLASFAAEHGARHLPEPPVVGLAAVVDAALDELALEGHRIALVLMADLPDLTAAEVRALLEHGEAASAVLVPNAAGTGTNAVRMPLPRRFDLALGDPQSLRLHRERATAAGLSVHLLPLASFARDVDVEDDLRDEERQRVASRSRTRSLGS